MWETLERARRRLLGDDSSLGTSSAGGPQSGAAAGASVDPPPALSFALGRTDLERLMNALSDVPGITDGRPDTPARLQAAIQAALLAAGGHGVPAVTRRPAGLYTPETWQIEVEGADATGRAVIEGAIRGGGNA